MGLYGVYVFFVLSGASLQLVYGDKLGAPGSLVEFLANRLFRLVPLMLLVALLVGLRQGPEAITKTWLTASLLLGFANPGATLTVTGAWSLGIEFVFYLVFPLLCALTRHRTWWITALVLFVSQRLYIEQVLGLTGLVAGWAAYTQPLSFASFFFVGCCIGRAWHESHLARLSGGPQAVWWSLFVVALAAIAFIPAPSPETLLLGIPAIAMTLLTWFVVLAACLLRGGAVFRGVSQFLGDISYGTYLLHPLVWSALERYGQALIGDVVLRRVLCVMLVVGLALLSNRYFEMPIRRLGRRFVDARRPGPLTGSTAR